MGNFNVKCETNFGETNPFEFFLDSLLFIKILRQIFTSNFASEFTPFLSSISQSVSSRIIFVSELALCLILLWPSTRSVWIRL